MSFRDCILGQIEDGALSKKKGEALLDKYEKNFAKYVNSGTPEAQALKAAEDVLAREAIDIQRKQINKMRAAIKQREWNNWANNTPGKIEAKVGETLQQAQWRTETVKKGAMTYLNQVADSIKINYAGLNRNYEAVKDGWRVALGDTAKTTEGQKVGEAFRKVYDYLETRYRGAGGLLGHIDNYAVQTTRKEALLNRGVKESQFVEEAVKYNDLSKIIDRDTGAPMTEAKFRKVTAEVYKNIMSDGRYSMEKLSQKGEKISGRKGDIDSRRVDARFFRFKNADAFLEWNSKYGYGDEGLAQAFFNHINSMSRDIGTMEIMGPKPGGLMKFMDFKMGAEGNSSIRRKFANDQYRVLTSSFQHGDTNAMWWRLFSGAQNWLRAAKLGAAALSAISDTTYIATTAKANGLSATRALKNYAAGLSPTDTEVRRIATRSGFIAERLAGAALGDTRFADESMSSGFTRVLANMVNELSGLQHMTRASQDAIALEGMATIAESLNKGWKNLDADLRDSLGRFGFNEADWNDLRLTKNSTYDSGDAQFLITSELRVDGSLDAKRSKQIADKLDDWTFMLRQAAANEQLLATRTISTGAFLGDGGLATPSRVVGSAIGLFKSFPITVMMTHLIPEMRKAGLTFSTISKPFNERRFQNLAMVLVGTTMMGAVVQQLKAAVQGKTSKDMFTKDGNPSYKFWMASFLQGGGAGLFGDFFFADYSRFGRNPITEATGPTVGLFEDVYMATKGNLDRMAEGKDTNVSRDIFRVVRQNIPIASSLWYTRLAFERLVLDQLERMIDPKFDDRIRKYERKMIKETGSQYWWAPGKTSPEGP